MRTPILFHERVRPAPGTGKTMVETNPFDQEGVEEASVNQAISQLAPADQLQFRDNTFYRIARLTAGGVPPSTIATELTLSEETIKLYINQPAMKELVMLIRNQLYDPKESLKAKVRLAAGAALDRVVDVITDEGVVLTPKELTQMTDTLLQHSDLADKAKTTVNTSNVIHLSKSKENDPFMLLKQEINSEEFEET